MQEHRTDLVGLACEKRPSSRIRTPKNSGSILVGVKGNEKRERLRLWVAIKFSPKGRKSHVKRKSSPLFEELKTGDVRAE